MDDRGIFSRLNPAYKMATHLVFMGLMAIISDPVTSFLLMLVPLIAVFVFVDVPKRKLLLYCSPFLLLFVLSVWSLAAFGKGETVWFAWAWFHFTQEGLMNGLTVGFRMLGFLFYGLLFFLTTDLTDFVLSLMQRFHLPPKWAYALLAGIRFVPMFWGEFAQIRAAHRIRGVRRAKGAKARLRALFRYTIPLLAQGIRRAERVAVALEARGFDGSWNRTFYRTVPYGRRDVYYVLAFAFAHAVLIYLSSSCGYIRWGLLL